MVSVGVGVGVMCGVNVLLMMGTGTGTVQDATDVLVNGVFGVVDAVFSGDG